MYFLAPWYLLGLAAAAIPIYLHLYSNRQAKVVDFSSLRLIKLSLDTQARWLRLQDVLLLALRVLLFALLPLALAKPALKMAGSKMPMLARPETSAVVVVDNSFSMGVANQGKTAFERAKTGASQLVRMFRTGDEAALYLVNSAVEPIFPSFTTDLDRVKEATEGLTLSQQTTKFTGVIAKCAELLAESKKTNKEIFIFSDFQASGWNLEQETALTLPKDVTIYLVDCGRDGGVNAAVTALRMEPGPKVVNRPIHVEADVRAYGAAAETLATLFVKSLGGSEKAAVEKPVDQRLLKLEAGKTETVRFEYTFPQTGRYELRAQLQPDTLPADDARWMVLPIRDQVRVLAVGGEKGIGALSDTFYLGLALRPQTSGDKKKWSNILLTSARASAMLERPLATYDVIFLCNVPGFSDAQVQALQDYVGLGGNLVFFLGDSVNLDNYLAKLSGGADGHAGLLPAKLLSPLRSPSRTVGHALSLSEVDDKHPLFAGLSDRAHQAIFGLKFSRYAALDLGGNAGGKVSVLAKLEEGTPMVVEKEVGRGRVLLFNTAADRGYGSRSGADTGWSNLVTSPIFPVLMQKTLDVFSAPSAGGSEVLVGESVPFLFPLEGTKTPDPLEILRPDGVMDAMIPRPEGGFLRANYVVNGPPGVYRATRGKSKEAKPMYFVANVDTAESDLTRVPLKDVSAKITGGSVVPVSDVAEMTAKVTRAREGFRLWPTLMVIILILLALESLISNLLWSPAQKKKKKALTIKTAAATAAILLLLGGGFSRAADPPPKDAPPKDGSLKDGSSKETTSKEPAKNLVPNGDFETGTDKMPAKWDHPAQWKNAHRGLVTTESRQADKEGDHKGGKCVHFNVPKGVGENEGLQIFSDFFPVPKDGDFDAVYRVKLDAKKVGTGMILWVDFFDAKKSKIYRSQFRPDCGSEWKTCERIFKVHVRAGQQKLHPEMALKFIQIELMCVYAGGEGWIDNVSLEQMPSDTPVEEPRHSDPLPLFPGGKKLE